jgi:hypothetical protein
LREHPSKNDVQQEQAMFLHAFDLARTPVTWRKRINELARHALVRFFSLP